MGPDVVDQMVKERSARRSGFQNWSRCLALARTVMRAGVSTTLVVAWGGPVPYLDDYIKQEFFPERETAGSRDFHVWQMWLEERRFLQEGVVPEPPEGENANASAQPDNVVSGSARGGEGAQAARESDVLSRDAPATRAQLREYLGEYLGGQVAGESPEEVPPAKPAPLRCACIQFARSINAHESECRSTKLVQRVTRAHDAGCHALGRGVRRQTFESAETLFASLSFALDIVCYVASVRVHDVDDGVNCSRTVIDDLLGICANLCSEILDCDTDLRCGMMDRAPSKRGCGGVVPRMTDERWCRTGCSLGDGVCADHDRVERSEVVPLVEDQLEVVESLRDAIVEAVDNGRTRTFYSIAHDRPCHLRMMRMPQSGVDAAELSGVSHRLSDEAQSDVDAHGLVCHLRMMRMEQSDVKASDAGRGRNHPLLEDMEPCDATVSAAAGSHNASPYVYVQFETLREPVFRALVDSGATHSCISRKAFESLARVAGVDAMRLWPRAHPTISVMLADGTSSRPLGAVVLSLGMRTVSDTMVWSEASFLILDNMAEDVILGIDWEERMGVTRFLPARLMGISVTMESRAMYVDWANTLLETGCMTDVPKGICTHLIPFVMGEGAGQLPKPLMSQPVREVPAHDKQSDRQAHVRAASVTDARGSKGPSITGPARSARFALRSLREFTIAPMSDMGPIPVYTSKRLPRGRPL